MNDVNLDELQNSLQFGVTKIIDMYKSDYIITINKQIADIEATKEKIEKYWKKKDERLTEINSVLTDKSWKDEEEHESISQEFMDLLAIFHKKEEVKISADEKIAKLERKKEDYKLKRDDAVDALYTFVSNLIEEDDRAISVLQKQNPELEASFFKGTEQVEGINRPINTHFFIMNYILNQKRQIDEELRKIKEKKEILKIQIDDLKSYIKEKKAKAKNGESFDIDFSDERDKKLLNLLILLEEAKSAEAKLISNYTELNNTYERMFRIVNRANKAIINLNSIFDHMKGTQTSEPTVSSIKEDTKEISSTKVENNGFELETVELEPNYETVKVTILFKDADGAIKEPMIITRNKGDLLDMGEAPTIDDHTFDAWVNDGNEKIDFSKPLEKDVTVVARYKKLYTINICNSKGEVINSIKVPSGTEIKGLYDELVPKKKFKEFSGWELSVENGQNNEYSENLMPINGAIMNNEPVYAVSDMTLTPKYKINRKKVLAVAAGVATAALATGADLLLSSKYGPTNGLISQGTAAINGILSGISAYKVGRTKEPNYNKEKEVKGIRKAGVKLLNHFRDNNNLRNWRDYFATTAVVSAVSGLTQAVHGALQKPEVTPDVKIFDDVPTKPEVTPTVEKFDGIDTNATIFKDPDLAFPNGKPNMQYIGDNGAVVRYFDSFGKEITTNTPISEISGPIKIVETQPNNGLDVVMGYMEDFASKAR